MKTKIFFLTAIVFALAMNAQAQFTFNYWSMDGNALTSSTANSFLGTTNSYPLVFKTNNTMRMCINASGNVGFGTTTPYQKIHVVDGNILISRTHTRAPGSRNGVIAFGDSISTNCTLGSWAIEYVNTEDEGYGLNFWRPWTSCNDNHFNNALFLANTGNIGIGTNNPQSKLAVNGGILAKSVRVNTSSTYWPDYVFSPSYDLMSLKELETFVTNNQHLPGVPSANEIGETDQVDLGEMNTLLLQKVEELTLYIIDLQKQIDELKTVKEE